MLRASPAGSNKCCGGTGRQWRVGRRKRLPHLLVTLYNQRFAMKYFTLLALLSATGTVAFGAAGTLHLLQKPAMNKTGIVFSYAGDLWTVSRQGGTATRLTAGAGQESSASFSPDGETIAFSGEYDGNTDVFTVAATGGIPKRVT